MSELIDKINKEERIQLVERFIVLLKKEEDISELDYRDKFTGVHIILKKFSK